MKKFTRNGLDTDNTYSGPSGRLYLFTPRQPTKVTDEKDIKFFEKSGDYTEVHDTVEAVKTVIEKAKKIVKKEQPFDEFLASFKGVDKEVADVIKTHYKDKEDFMSNISEHQLRTISGIGKKRASDIMKQVDVLKLKEKGD